MSTRANVIIQETIDLSHYDRANRIDRLYFYRHSDGYPEGVKETLDKFIEWVKKDKVRDNLSQSAGWLILLGAIEYNTIPKYKLEDPNPKWGTGYADMKTVGDPEDWKAGAYEPTTCIHGDIEHLYLVDINKKEWREVPRKDWNKYDNK